jgi:hypothetical protein
MLLTCGATAADDPPEDIRYIWTFELQILGSNGWAREDRASLLDRTGPHRAKNARQEFGAVRRQDRHPRPRFEAGGAQSARDRVHEPVEITIAIGSRRRFAAEIDQHRAIEGRRCGRSRRRDRGTRSERTRLPARPSPIP